MKTRITSLFLVLCMLFSLSACTGESTKQDIQTKTITDCIGRTVEIPKDPQRVACLYASIAHMMALLNQQGKIVGAPNGVKRDVLMQILRPDIIEISTPYQSGSINVEELIKTNTDLVLIQTATAMNDTETAKLDKLGIPYAVIDYTNMSELKNAITIMGKIFNEDLKAENYIKFFDDTISLVKTNLSTLQKSQEVSVYHSINEAVKTDIKGGICDEIFTSAHLKNVAVTNEIAIESDKATNTTLEEIYKWNPQAIVCNEYAVTNYILTDNKWAGLAAVESKKVYTLPIGATRWGHQGSIEAHMGVLALAYMFYPDYFKDFNYRAYIKNYYKTYFNVDLTEEQIEMVISGNGMREAKS